MRIPDDEDLRDLGELDPVVIRRRLREQHPRRVGVRDYWWEDITWRALLGVYGAQDDQTRGNYASVVKAATDEAVDLGALSAIDGAIRVASLAVYLERHGQALFDVNAVVRACLSLTGLSFDKAAARAVNWRLLPHPEKIALRRAKNLVSACAPLMDSVTDAALLANLKRWAGLRDQLP